MLMRATCKNWRRWTMIVALIIFTPMDASSTTYLDYRPVGSGSADISITTDGTLGILATSNVIGWTIALKNGADTVTLLGPLSGNNSELRVAGSGLSATATDLLFNFDFAAIGYSYALFQRGFVGSSAAYYCVETSGCGILGESLLASPNLSVFEGVIASVPRQGIQIIASVQAPIPEPPMGILLMVASFALVSIRVKHFRLTGIS